MRLEPYAVFQPISSNCRSRRHTFLPAELPPDSVGFSMRLWVDDSDRAQPLGRNLMCEASATWCLPDLIREAQ